MNLYRFSLVVTSLLLVIAGASAQTPPPDSSVPPKAPPAVVGTSTLLMNCLNLDQNQLTQINFPSNHQSAGDADVQATLKIHIHRAANTNAITVSCAGAQQPEGYSVDYSGVYSPVWLADESKNQRDFLRAEVKASIEQALMDKVVNSQTIRDATTKALQDPQILKDAISEVLLQKLPQIKQDIITAVVVRIKADQAKTDKGTPKPQ